jgi:dynamin 1-like protein
MESCYINTAHPDFLSGHKAISMVNEQITAKNQRQVGDRSPAKSQVPSLQTNGSSASSVDSNDSGSFFGSFFSGNKKSTKSGSALMEAVSTILIMTIGNILNLHYFI